jgi:type VI secretion system protein ImpK
MAEEPKQSFDPEATVAQPMKVVDPGADPEATVTLPGAAIDPEATLTGPLNGPPAKVQPDLEAAVRRPDVDPEATLNPVAQPQLDPDATVRIASLGKQRRNPFAPKSPPEVIQANLAALGGLNQLVAMANPILAAVPQIRRSLKHPDAAGLLANLKDQIESLEMSAVSAEVADDTVSAAVYALCALLDESAAATPWGRDWINNGLLMTMRGESGGAEGFFTQLDHAAAEPDKNADLLEFFYICLALGFEGRYRGAEGARQELDQTKNQLYGLITRKRPRPDALSERWRTPAAQAAADSALQTAARANAARAAAEAAARDAEATIPPRPAKRFALAHLPRRAIWSAVAGIVGAAIVFYMLALRLLDENDRAAMSAKPGARTKAGPATSSPPAPVAASAATALATALEGLPVTVSESAGGIALRIADDRQFASGSNQPVLQMRALLPRIAESLDKLPGTIVVIGHADAAPPGRHYASNADLSAARARSAARLMAPKLSDPKRLATEGRGEAEPLAPNDTESGRAKNRRVAILLKVSP